MLPSTSKSFLMLSNIMFHALMGRFHLELFFSTYFPTVVPLTSCVFVPVGLSSLKKLHRPTKSVEKVALTTKGLQERKQLVSLTTVEK